MFDLGTKIVILASTRKKGVGPRKGSVGYASACQNRGIFDQYALVTTLNEVFFFRYGFETQERVEKKAIISVFPIIKPDQGDIHSQVRSLIKRIHSPKSSQVWDEVRAYYDVVPRVPITLVAPLNCCRTDVSKASTKEFYSWLESLLLGSNLLSFLNDAVSSRHVTNTKMSTINMDSLEMIRNMIMDKGYKQSRMADFSHSAKAKKETVEFLQPLLAFAGRYETSKTASSYESYLTNNLPRISGKFPPNVLLDHLINYLYSPSIFAAFKRTLTNVENTGALRVMEDVEYAKAEIMVLSSQLWRAGLIDGKSASKV
jgi:hypothetical protein